MFHGMYHESKNEAPRDTSRRCAKQDLDDVVNDEREKAGRK